MSSMPGILSAVLILMAPAALAQTDEHGDDRGPMSRGRVALYDNLGSHHHQITTAVDLAQEYYDQGLRLLYAFNHAEAANSFREAERIDPKCAMCAWGIALALGPNINDAMSPDNNAEAHAALQRALAGAADVTPREQSFIRAMAERYSATPEDARANLDSAYASAMREVADAHPNDMEAQVLYADALMNLSPWYYWEHDGSPRPGTRELLSRLEYVMEEDPNHPGACHLFIHAEEAHDPTRAVDCAERLAGLMPGAGHLVHMPGHIYIRVGRYADAIEQNKHAVHADESYLEGAHVSHRGIYPEGYYPHNYHFMSFAASMAGDSETAIYAARQVAEKLGPEATRKIGWLEAVTPVVYWTLVTFGQWDQILAEPLPPADRRFTLGQAYYARGIAFAAKGMWVEAQVALDSVRAIAENFRKPTDVDPFASDLKIALDIAGHALAGEIALRRDEPDEAAEEFRSAVELEDSMVYTEPPTWYYPMRQSLGVALLAAGRAAKAERVYREDLARFPENGWSLFGLHQSLQAQGKSQEAREVKERFEQAWQHADVTLVASRF